MKITLKEWRQIITATEKARIAQGELSNLLIHISGLHFHAGNEDETRLLMILESELNNDGKLPCGINPQSEWMGGDSSDPSNHKLREPDCCPAPRRHFTNEEIIEAGAQCHGACQWTYHQGDNQ